MSYKGNKFNLITSTFFITQSGSLIYNYLCNQCLSSLTLWVWIPLKQSVLYTTLWDKVCQWLAADQWFSLCTPVSSTNKGDHSDIAEILFKVALNTNPNLITQSYTFCFCFRFYVEIILSKIFSIESHEIDFHVSMLYYCNYVNYIPVYSVVVFLK